MFIWHRCVSLDQESWVVIHAVAHTTVAEYNSSGEHSSREVLHVVQLYAVTKILLSASRL